jgi:imidazoleglycerol-phosphate dehydratase/histidinol-phosphatase
MKKVLFIDRDGTIILETEDFIIDTMQKVAFYPNVFYWLGKIAREFDYKFVLVTNQDGMGTEAFPDEPFFTTHKFIMKTFADQGIVFADEHIDRSFPEEKIDTRKPGTGMLKKYFNGDYDLKSSFVIGDRITDVMLAKNLGAKCFWLKDNRNLGSNEINHSEEELREFIATQSRDWKDIYEYLKSANTK